MWLVVGLTFLFPDTAGHVAWLSMAGAEEREARSIALEKAYVHEVYEQISCQFTDGRFRAWPRVKQFVSELEPGSLVCDVGCGNGKYLNINPAAFKIGSDRCKKLTEVAREKEHEVLICDNLALPFRDESFDAVLSIAVVHHFATTERRVHALRELARVLRIGGRLIITVWAMEQRHRKFESQDVLVPWHKPQHFSSDDKTPSVERDLTSTTTSEEDGHPYNAYTQTSDSDSCRSPRTGQRKRGRSRHKGRSIDPSRPSSSQSSSDLSSPNETCYSFVRRALQKLAGGKRSGSGHRPWFLQTLDSSKPWGSCTKEPPHTPELDKQDSLGNIEDLPIELRRLEEDEPTIVTTQRRQTFACQAPVHETVTLNQKSKSLSDILGVLSTGLLRPRKPNGEVTNLVRSRSSFSSLAPLGECEAGTSSVSTAVTSITITTTSTTTTIVMSSTTSSTTTSTGRPGRPVLVKQKKSIHESDGEEESAENRDTLAEMRNIVKSLPEFKVRDSPVRSSRKNIFKQSSLNEELMSTERLREKERVRQNIQKQASLNEELICNKPRSDKLDSIRESLFSANNKRFQMLKNGLTKLKSTSITKSEVKKDTKGQYSFRNGFVRMLQSWKSDVGVLSTSVDSAGKVPSSEADSEEQSDSSSAFNEQGGKGKKSLQPLFNRKERNPAALRAWASQGDSGDSLESSSPKRKNADESEEPREKERRPSKEDGSDSSKDSSLQSDTSVDSEDSFASVIFIPKPEPKGEQEDEPPPKSPLKTNGSRAVIPDPPPAESEKQVTVEKTTPAEEEPKPVVNNSPPLEDEPEDTFVKIQELVRKHCSDLQLDVLESPKEVSPIVPIVFPRPEYPFVRRGSARPTQLPARTIPKLLSLELFNPETDDLDSDSSGVSSPDSVSSVISVMNEGPEQSSQSDLPAPEASSSSNRQDNIESSQAEPTAAPEASATQSTQSEGELADANGGKSEGPQEESSPETPTNNQQCLPIKQEPSEASAMATSPSPTDNKDQVAENSTSSSSLQLEDKDNLFLLDEGLDDSSSSAQSKSPSSTLLEAAASVASSLEGAVDAVIQSSPRARRKLLENPLTALGYWSLQSDSKYAANSEGLIRGTKQVLTQACCGVNLEEIDADDYRKSSSSSSSEDCRQHLTEFAEKLSEALLEEIDRYSESCGASNSIRSINLKSLPQSTVRKYSCEFAHDVHDLKQSASEHSCRAFDASFSNDTGKSYSYPTSLHSAEASLLSAPFRELGREIAEQSRVTSTVRKRSPISDRYHSEGDYSPDHIGKSRSPIREYQEGIIPHRSPTFERKKKLSETHSPIGAGLSRTSLKECDAVKRDSSRTIAQDSGSSSRFASLGNEYTSFNLPRSPVSERNVQSSTSTGISSICGRDRLTETGLFQPYTSSLPLQHDSSRLGHKQSPDTKDNGALYAWKSKSPVKDFSFLDSSQLISPSRSPGRETKISQIGTPTRDTVSAQEDKLLLSRESAFRDNAKPRSPVAESIRKSPLQQRRLMDYSRSPGEEITFEKCMKSPIKEASYRSRSMSKSPTGDTCVDSKSPDRVDGTYLLSSKFLAKNNIPMEFGSTSSVANTGNFLETRKSGFSAEEEAVGIIRRTPSPMSDKTFSDLKIRSPVSEEKHIKTSPTKSPSKEDKMKLYSSIQAAKTFMESMEKKSPIRETTYLDSSKSSSPVKDRTLIDFPKSRPLRKGSFWDLATSWSAKDEECFTEANASRKATKEGFFKGYKNYRSRFGRMLAYGDRTPLDPLRTMSPVREDDIDPVQDRNYERVTMRLAQSGRLLREQSKMKTQQYQSDMGKEDNKCEISKETSDTLQPESKEKSTKVSDSSIMEDLSQTVYDPLNCADSPVSVDSKDNTESHKKIVSKISDDQEKPSTSKTTKVACSVDSNECTLRKSCDQSSTLASVSRGIVISDSSSKVAVAEVKVLPQDKPKAEEEANETSSVNSSENCPTNLHASCSSVQPKSSVSKGVEESASKCNEEKVGNCQTPCTSIVQKEDKCSGKKCNNGTTSKHTVQNRKEEVNEESIAGKSVKEPCTDSKKASVETKKTNSKLVQEAAASNSLNSSVIKGSSARNESSIRMENAAKHENNTESKSSEKPKTCHLPMPNKKVAIRASSLESALPSRRSDMESIHAADRKMPSAEHIEKDSKSVKSTSQLQLPAKKVAIRSSSLESSMPCNHGDQMLKDKKEANGAHVEQLAKEAMLNATNKERKFGSKDSGSRSASCESKTIDEQQPADIESVQKTASCETSLSGSTSQDSLQSDTGGALTFHRYYHVFREGELDQLIERYVDNLHIISSYYDHANWCVIAEKVQVWTI